MGSLYQRAFGRLVHPRSSVDRLLRLAVLGLAAFGLARFLLFSWLSLQAPFLYGKDFLQEYLLAKAILEGVDPYLPIRTLAAHYGITPWSMSDLHPTPHPPTAGLLCLPISMLSYADAAVAWLLLELAAFSASIYLLLVALGLRRPLMPASLAFVMATTWSPLFDEVSYGQWTVILLALGAATQLLLLRRRSALGGLLLGLSLWVKPILWPFLLLLAARRDWLALSASVVTGMAGYVLAMLAVGPGTVAKYFTDVLPAVTLVFRAYPANISLWSVGWRVFYGTESIALPGFNAPPLFGSGGLAAVTSGALPAAVSGLGLLLASRQRRLQPAVAIVVCVSILVSPISWQHYMVLAAVPIAWLIQWLVSSGLPTKETSAALLVGMLLSVPYLSCEQIAHWLVGQTWVPDTVSTLPFAAGTLTLVPTAGLCGLLCLVAVLGARPPSDSGPDEVRRTLPEHQDCPTSTEKMSTPSRS